ncbi:isopeptide-forming domain-containing fimbrial protein [uncultured Catenibacterium sp.]|uniref:isopeptide-forming domain-containing fimbrial protein n=1 Tax=uncultured Catenibacterium sp. TaxID=286142 RepID=UPI0025D87E53|nr:isopeptide-forming domain-containing fimbrial protein [uncultured Catenibacterium sp.]
MKLFKKIAGFILAFAMILAIAMPSVVMAEGNGSITITGAKSGHTFEAYQIFAGDLSEDGKSPSNITWGSDVTEAGKTKFGDAQDKAGSLEGNRPAAVTFANEVSNYLAKPSGTSVEDGENYKIKDLTPGYYLVKDKDDSVSGQDSYTKFILEVVGNDVSAQVKSSVPTSEKKVKDTNDTTGETTGWQDSADYDIGDEVPFQLTGHVATDYNQYKSAYQLVFHDTLSDGLTVDRDSFKVYKNGSDNALDADKYEVNITDDQHFTVTIKDVKSLGTDVSKVRVEYTAKLNDKAAIGSAGNPNTMYMEFSNNPNSTQGGSKGQTPKDKVIVFTYKTVINKINSSHQSLKGAAFKLEKVLKNGSKKTVKEYTITDSEEDRNRTSFEFTGLDDGEYILTETETPDGYNTMHPITFSITASHDTDSADPKLNGLNGNLVDGQIIFTADKDEGTLTADVVNYKGSELPNTGGMGTTILYVAGAVMILAAGAFLVMQKKAEDK